jgi:hypothetical protein
MASIREAVSFPGILRGGGHEANCTVLATKVSLPGGGPGAVAYCEYDIKNVSKALPDGVYQLLARGETTSLRHTKEGYWLAA